MGLSHDKLDHDSTQNEKDQLNYSFSKDMDIYHKDDIRVFMLGIYYKEDGSRALWSYINMS